MRMAEATLIRDAAATQKSASTALDAVWLLASTSYGPAGRSKLVRANEAAALTVTTTSHVLFSAVKLDEPVAKVILELLAARQQKGADGGLFTVMFAASLLRGVWRSRLPPRIAALLLPEALAWCASYARSGSAALAGRFRMSALPCLLALVRGVLAPKHVALPAGDDSALQQLCVLVVSAFVRAAPRSGGGGGGGGGGGDDEPNADLDVDEGSAPAQRRAARLLPSLRTLPLVGCAGGATTTAESCQVIDGVLLDLPTPEGWDALARPPAGGAATAAVAGSAYAAGVRVALYTESLHAQLPDAALHGARVSLDGSAGGVAAAGTAAEAMLRRFADGVAAAGVRLLLCQKLVAPALSRLLRARGVCVLPRLSLRHIGAARRLSGATALAQPRPPAPHELGRLGGVGVRVLGQGKEFLHLLPCDAATDGACGAAAEGAADSAGALAALRRAEPICTLLLCAPHAAARDELSLAVSCALATLGSALCERRPTVLPGAGAFEVVAAARLRQDAARLPQPLQPPQPPQEPQTPQTPPPQTLPPQTPQQTSDQQPTFEGGASSTASTAEAIASAAAAAAARRQRQLAWRIFAEALEATAAALAANGSDGAAAGRTTEDVLEALRGANAGSIGGCDDGGGACGVWAPQRQRPPGAPPGTAREQRPLFGWDVDAGAPMEVACLHDGRSDDDDSDDDDSDDDDDDRGQARPALSVARAHVVELTSAKIDAMAAAVEVACALVGVDGVLVDAR